MMKPADAKKNAARIIGANEIPTDENQNQKQNSETIDDGQSYSDASPDTAGLEELCGETIGLMFEGWELFAKLPKELTPKEKEFLGGRLAKILRKRNIDIDKFVKDEFIFIGALLFCVGKRQKAEQAIRVAEIKRQQEKAKNAEQGKDQGNTQKDNGDNLFKKE